MSEAAAKVRVVEITVVCGAVTVTEAKVANIRTANTVACIKGNVGGGVGTAIVQCDGQSKGIAIDEHKVMGAVAVEVPRGKSSDIVALEGESPGARLIAEVCAAAG